jgi:Flp pilus assembly pilin Flp
MARINSITSDEEGANAVEYSLVLGLVAIALVVAAVALTPILNTFVAEIGTWMEAQGVS